MWEIPPEQVDQYEFMEVDEIMLQQNRRNEYTPAANEEEWLFSGENEDTDDIPKLATNTMQLNTLRQVTSKRSRYSQMTDVKEVLKKNKTQTKITDWFVAKNVKKKLRNKKKRTQNKRQMKKRYFQSNISTWTISFQQSSSKTVNKVTAKDKSSRKKNYVQLNITRWTVRKEDVISHGNSTMRAEVPLEDNMDILKNVSIDSEIERFFLNDPDFFPVDSSQFLVDGSNVVQNSQTARNNISHSSEVISVMNNNFTTIDNLLKLNEDTIELLDENIMQDNSKDFKETQCYKTVKVESFSNNTSLKTKTKKKKHVRKHTYVEVDNKLIKCLKPRYVRRRYKIKKKVDLNNYYDVIMEEEEKRRKLRKKKAIRELLIKYVWSQTNY